MRKVKLRDIKLFLESSLLLSHLLNMFFLFIKYERSNIVHNCPPMFFTRMVKIYLKGGRSFRKMLCVSDDGNHSASI